MGDFHGRFVSLIKPTMGGFSIAIAMYLNTPESIFIVGARAVRCLSFPHIRAPGGNQRCADQRGGAAFCCFQPPESGSRRQQL